MIVHLARVILFDFTEYAVYLVAYVLEVVGYRRILGTRLPAAVGLGNGTADLHQVWIFSPLVCAQGFQSLLPYGHEPGILVVERSDGVGEFRADFVPFLNLRFMILIV